jgi:uncharacterized protein (DUF433 family)
MGDIDIRKEATHGRRTKESSSFRETVREIDKLAKERGEDFSATAKNLLEEAIKMRRCPGIVFAPGISGRRARVAGTGIEVWEVVAQYKSSNRDQKRLRQAFHWLTPGQIKAALGYYAAYPAEIEALIERNEQWTEETLEKRHPALSPKV